MRVTPMLIISAVLTVVLAVCCLYTWSSGSHQRQVASAWREAREKLISDDPGGAIESLERFLELRPDLPHVRLQLAGIYLRKGQQAKARAHYQKVAKDELPGFDGGEQDLKELRALAEVALGMMDGAAGIKTKDPVKRKAKLASAKTHFEAAIKIEHPQGLNPKPGEIGEIEEKSDGKTRGKLAAFGDACAGLGLVALWAGDYDEAEKRFKQALSDKTVLSKEVLPELYNALGVAVASNGQPTAAPKYFKMSKVYKADKAGKKWRASVPDKNLQIIQRGMADSPDMKPELRRKLLAQLVKGLKSKKKRRYETYNLLGCGYYRLGDVGKALKYLDLAVKQDPDRLSAQINLLAVRWKIYVAKRAEYLEKRAEFFPLLPGDPDTRRWQTPVPKQIKPKRKKGELVPFRALQKEFSGVQASFDAASARALARAKGLPPELERSLILLRLEMIPSFGRRLARSKDGKRRERGKKLLASLDELLAEGLKKFPKEYRFHRLQGIRRLKAGDIKGALAAFDESLVAKADQPDVRALQAIFAPAVKVVVFRPAAAPGVKGGSVLARSSRPLLGALFRVHTGPVPLDGEKVKLKLDGQEVDGYFWGSEFLHLPAKELADGKHVLEAQAEDFLGRKASGKFEFQVDGSPPEIYKTEPADGGKVRDSRPKLVIHYRDKYSGIDTASVEVEFSTIKAATWIRENPVRGGRHYYNNAALGIKKGAPVGDNKVVFSSSRNLGPGDYQVKISVQDARGLKAEKVWKFTVVK